MRTVKTIVGCAVILWSWSCKDIYDPHIDAKTTGLLVVEGFINTGQGPTTMRLSRSSDLQSTSLNPESSARVTVEGEDGSNFTLDASGSGMYSNSQLVLNSGIKYRVHIKTADGKEYASDYAPVKYTPPIDSITWQRENEGLRIYANARDAHDSTKYYQWKYEETWEIHSAYYSTLKYVFDPATGNPVDVTYRNADLTADTTIYKCWNTLSSTSIILGSTEKLASDVVFLPVQYIEPHSEKLSVLYSINLRQYAISHDEYLFLQKMKKNTEQLGTIFDPQPSEISGNIHCLTDPNEIVIGFVEASQEQVRRIFISSSEVPDWNYDADCVFIEIVDDPDSIGQYGIGLLPTTMAKIPLFGPKTFYASTPPCVDCTTRGIHQRPDFWP